MFSFLKKESGIEVKAPVNGEIFPIESVNDPVFSEKMMGDGIAIKYAGGDVVAPVTGKITSVILPSCHAFGIRCESGLDVLVHVGLDVVKLKGEGFQLLKKKGEMVHQGEAVIKVDYDLLKDKGLDLITPIVITNSNEFLLNQKAQGQAESGRTNLFFAQKK